MRQLLERGVAVRAIVRSADKLAAVAAGEPGLTVVEAEVSALRAAELREHLLGCDAVVSCLGHNISFAGMVGKPRDLVERAVERVCGAARALQPAAPIRFILMSSVSVNRPDKLDTRRGTLERAFLWALRGLLPPAADNQRAADFLLENVGAADPYVRWVAVRPDSLLEGDVTGYAIHEGLVDSLFKPGATNMANVARFMCDLVEDAALFDRWAGKLPVVVNAAPR
jgi:nucleoside-diphosphate-sugar epimerase